MKRITHQIVRGYRCAFAMNSKHKTPPKPSLFSNSKKVATAPTPEPTHSSKVSKVTFEQVCQNLATYYVQHIAKSRFQRRDVQPHLVERLLNNYPPQNDREAQWVADIKKSDVLKARLSPYLLTVNHNPKISPTIFWYFYVVGFVVIAGLSIAIYQTSQIDEEDMEYIQIYMEAMSQQQEEAKTSKLGDAHEAFERRKMRTRTESF